MNQDYLLTGNSYMQTKWLNNKSRVMGDYQARFCESLEWRLLWATRPYIKLEKGFVYLAAIIFQTTLRDSVSLHDWNTKKILS
jgi:hypothetical protein